jgi:magnesium transporter
MIEKLALPEIRELLNAGDLSTLSDVLNGWFAADLAGVLDALDQAEKVRVLRALEPGLASHVYEYLDLATQESVCSTT